ncbi:FkbM family methyltransferase [Pseudonocardia acaciae]|uniref:FkbM family methyltransferase n=1 Tax=Pseudonocardia acaciae TaxID=551276 RepID=UPI0004920EF8|nr:FkbM family methyltransferase [Pseudonocardia acaciae]
MHEMQLPNGLLVQQVNPGETALLYRDIFTERCYMRRRLSLNPGDTVFDVGANIGMAALFFHLECPGLTFHVFEPAPIPYAALIANLAAHGLSAHPSRCALGESPGVGRLTYYPDSTVMSGLYADAEAEAALTRTYLTRSGFDSDDVREMLSGRHENTVMNCPVQTLSAVIAARGVESIDLLKLDVEKSELDVLRGLDERDWPKVRQVVAEVHDIGGALKSFTALLEVHGFDVETEQDELLRGTEIFEVFAFRKGG